MVPDSSVAGAMTPALSSTAATVSHSSRTNHLGSLLLRSLSAAIRT
jgi:hypothetical protein